MPTADSTLPLSRDRIVGLSATEAARRLHADGPNELPGHRPRNLLAIVREVLSEPMFLLLIAAAAIYIVLGDVREASVLAASIVVIIVITVLQQRRTEHALVALRDLSSPRALVIRDGVEQRIAGSEVVAGDIVLLREGDRVPADGVLFSATALSVDESILTGESLPVDKTAGSSEAARVYSGSLVVRGFGAAEVQATGVRSEIGRIGHALTTLTDETTPLFREVRRVVRWVALSALLLCAAIAVIYTVARTDWLGGVLAGITLAMGILPEEFPVVLTVFLAMGAWRISRAGVLTRRMPAIESIGAATVLAVDKTGTLTENRMRVALIETDHSSCDMRHDDPTLNDAAQSVLATALAASERDAFDPMERAIHEAARRWIPASAERLHTMNLVREYDLTPELLAVTHVWQQPGCTHFEVTVKGAPETVRTITWPLSTTRSSGGSRRGWATSTTSPSRSGTAGSSRSACSADPGRGHNASRAPSAGGDAPSGAGSTRERTPARWCCPSTTSSRSARRCTSTPGLTPTWPAPRGRQDPGSPRW